jgi:hypothetical protein
MSHTTGKWYHVSISLNTSTKAYRIRVWDDNASSVTESTGSVTNAVTINDSEAIGAKQSGIVIDELYVYSGILSAADMDAIRGGTYAAVNNDYSTEPRAVASWPLDGGVHTADVVGTNTLTDSGTSADAVTFKEGGGSLVSSGGAVYMKIADADMDSDFPLSNGASQPTFSVCFWYRPSSVASTGHMIEMGNTLSASAKLEVTQQNSGKIRYQIGYNNGANYEAMTESTTQMTVSQWYFIGISHDDVAKKGILYIYDATGASDETLRKTFTNNVNQSAGDSPPLYIMNNTAETSAAPGRYDVMTWFNRALLVEEMKEIRQGVYEGPMSVNTVLPGHMF